MKARPILFSGEMVRALLEGRKTQTRRIIKDDLWVNLFYGELTDDGMPWVENPNTGYRGPIRCPYGQPDDLLWVRETFGIGYDDGDDGYSAIPWTGSDPKRDGKVFYRASFNENPEEGRLPWKPSIHMPRWASRLTLRITDVRVERVQDISRDDAVAEGCVSPLKGTELEGVPGDYVADERTSFAQLWSRINGRESWQANPWVWVVQFEVIHANVDQVLNGSR